MLRIANARVTAYYQFRFVRLVRDAIGRGREGEGAGER